MRRQAFTLIELLVVIAIIAILASILFPVFARAKHQANNITGISNLRQIGTAGRLYMTDNDNLWPATDSLGMSGGGANIRALNDPYGLPALLKPYSKSDGIWFSPNHKPSLRSSGVGVVWSSNLNVAGADIDMFENGSSDNRIVFDAYYPATPATGVKVMANGGIGPLVKAKNDTLDKWHCPAMQGKGIHWLYADGHVKAEHLAACPANKK